jgi:hypothetical protein
MCDEPFILIDFRLDWLRASYLFAGSILIFHLVNLARRMIYLRSLSEQVGYRRVFNPVRLYLNDLYQIRDAILACDPETDEKKLIARSSGASRWRIDSLDDLETVKTKYFFDWVELTSPTGLCSVFLPGSAPDSAGMAASVTTSSKSQRETTFLREVETVLRRRKVDPLIVSFVEIGFPLLAVVGLDLALLQIEALTAVSYWATLLYWLGTYTVVAFFWQIAINRFDNAIVTIEK